MWVALEEFCSLPVCPKTPVTITDTEATSNFVGFLHIPPLPAGNYRRLLGNTENRRCTRRS